MHSAHSTFLPELDLNPPASWAKPASALGLSNPLNHLPQVVQVQKLQEQIQHHRQLQRTAQNPGKNKRNSSTSSTKSPPNSASNGYTNTDTISGESNGNNSNNINNRHSQHIPRIQHINITTNDDDSNMNEEDTQDFDNNDDKEHTSYHTTGIGASAAMDIKPVNSRSHNRSSSQPQLTHGFNIQGFNGFHQGGSPMSPSSSGTIMSGQNNSFTASVLTPGLLSQNHNTHGDGIGGYQVEHSYGDNNYNMSIGGVASSLATLSVISSSLSSMPNGGGGGPAPLRRSASSHATSSSSSFQPQSLPVIYQNQVAESVGGHMTTHNTNMFN
ncbi:hypothetical protein BG004_002503, partial [Podila humilis]